MKINQIVVIFFVTHFFLLQPLTSMFHCCRSNSAIIHPDTQFSNKKEGLKILKEERDLLAEDINCAEYSPESRFTQTAFEDFRVINSRIYEITQEIKTDEARSSWMALCFSRLIHRNS